MTERSPIPARIAAGTAYFGIIFLLGFWLGTVRVLVLTPQLGELFSVSLEVPVMLAVAWWVCDRLIKRFQVPATERLAMGAIALGWLLLAETGLGVGLLGQSWGEYLGHYATLPGLVGLLGQVAFAAFPRLQPDPDPPMEG